MNRFCVQHGGKAARPLLALLGAVVLWGCVVPLKPKPTLLQSPVEVLTASEDLGPIPEKIRICTYNIQDFTDGVEDELSRTAAVIERHTDSAAKMINEIKPDILLLEETENGAILTKLNDKIHPPYPVAYISQFGGQGRDGKLNIAVLSRLPILKARELDFESLDAENHPPRGALTFAVNLGENHFLLVYGVHLKSNWGDKAANVAKRQRALSVVRAHAELITQTNSNALWEIVVAGDMNVDPELESFQGDRSLDPLKDWVDLWAGIPIEDRTTIPTRHGDPALEFPSACFDRIIVSPSLREKPWVAGTPRALQKGADIENVFTLGGQSEKQVSDHYPAYVDLRH